MGSNCFNRKARSLPQLGLLRSRSETTNSLSFYSWTARSRGEILPNKIRGLLDRTVPGTMRVSLEFVERNSLSGGRNHRADWYSWYIKTQIRLTLNSSHTTLATR